MSTGASRIFLAMAVLASASAVACGSSRHGPSPRDTAGRSGAPSGGAPGATGGDEAEAGAGSTSLAGSTSDAGKGGAVAGGGPGGTAGAPVGGQTAIGGVGNVSSGGTPGAGGMLAGGKGGNGGNGGNGCDGSFEEFLAGEIDLCAAKMVTIAGPEDGPSYQIDATEVTVGQYWQWLNTEPPLPPSTNMICGWKAIGTYHPNADTFTGDDAEHRPITDVDWCDAQYYCSAVGKRLCGGIGGGSNPYDSYDDATRSQWYRACSSGGEHLYPYGDTFDASACNDGQPFNNQTTLVGSMSGCASTDDGYQGVYDLSGNVLEWEDSCLETTCRFRGGAYGYVVSDTNEITCREMGSYGFSGWVQESHASLGFRCCSR